MPDLMKIFHRLPYSLRVLAVSLQGTYLNWWRYNNRLESMVAETLERDQWPAARWNAWQSERLERMLHHAATTVPYYRDQWQQRRRRSDRASWNYLENWPILRKDSIRHSPEAFLSEQYARGGLLRERTGGTTGTPLQLFADRRTLIEWYALAEARWRRWYGVSNRDRWANLGVRPIVPFENTHPPFWVWNAAMRQLYLSALHIKPEYMDDYVNAMSTYRIDYLYGYPSAYFWLARNLIDYNERLPMKVVITSSENLFDYQRETMQEAFEATVRETYGQSEKICAASECEHGRLHLWPEAGKAEFLPADGSSQSYNSAHMLICTSLLNQAMPLIRYDIQDMIELPLDSEPCTCGRGLPVMGKVLGRFEDMVLTPDGRRVGHLVGFLSAGAPVKEIQVIQETLHDIRVKVVPAQDWSTLDEKVLIDKLHSRIGDCAIKVDQVPAIERSKSGKFRAVISKVESILPQSK